MMFLQMLEGLNKEEAELILIRKRQRVKQEIQGFNGKFSQRCVQLER